jgi:hypothetical protein
MKASVRASARPLLTQRALSKRSHTPSLFSGNVGVRITLATNTGGGTTSTAVVTRGGAAATGAGTGADIVGITKESVSGV